MKKKITSGSELIRIYESQKNGGDFSFLSSGDFVKIMDFYFDLHKNAEALEAGEIANKEYPYNTNIILNMVRIQSQSREFEPALDLLEKAILIDPSNADIHYWLGKIYDEVSESDLAIEHFDLSLDNDFAQKDDIYLGKAIVYIHDENYAEAKLNLRKALKINPLNDAAIGELINSCSDKDEIDDAICFYEKIIDRDPYNNYLWNNLGLLFDSFQMQDRAIETFELSASLNDKEADTYFFLGNAYLNKENYSKATGAFRRAIDLGKDEYMAWSQLGLAYTYIDEFDEATKCFLTSVELEPDFAEGWFGLGIVDENQGDHLSAIHYFKKAISLNPSNEKFYYEMAFCQSILNQHTEAEKSFKQSVDLNPFFTDAWIDYALFLYENLKISDAINTMLEAITFNSDDAELYYVLSGILYDKGFTNRGRFYLERALKINPNASGILFEIFPYLYSNDKIIELINSFR